MSQLEIQILHYLLHVVVYYIQSYFHNDNPHYSPA